MTFFTGGGFDETTPAVSYNKNKGPGYGSRNSEGLNQSYPNYNYNVSEQNAATAIINIKQQNSNSQFFEGGLQDVIDIMVYKQDKFGIEILVYNTNYGFYFEQSEGIVRYGYPKRTGLKNSTFLTFDENLMGYYKTSNSAIHCTPYHLNPRGELTLYTLGSSKNYGKPNYILHTHPRASHLSGQDLIQMRKYGVPTWVISPNGGIWGEEIYWGGDIDEVWVSPN
jgi:hypothetical protein